MGTRENPRGRREGGLYIRKRKVWNEVKNIYEEVELVQATKEVRDPNNPEKRIRITGTARTPAEAKERLDKSYARYMMKKGLSNAGLSSSSTRVRQGMTVEEYLNMWFDGLKADRVATSTRGKYRTHIDLHIVPHIGNLHLTEISDGKRLIDLFENVLPGLKAEKGKGKGQEQRLSPAAILNIYKTMNNAMNKAVSKYFLLKKNPMGAVDVPIYEPPREPIFHYLHVVMGMFRSMKRDDHPDYNRFLLALLGLRKGERLGISFKDLNLKAERPTMTIRHQLARETGRGLFLKLETKNSLERTIVLTDPWLTMFKEMVQVRKMQKKNPKFKPTPEFEDLVFLRDDGKPYDLNDDNDAWIRINKKYNDQTPPIRGHALRHVAATHMADIGMDIETVKVILGHETEAMAYYYARISPTKQEPFVTAFGKATSERLAPRPVKAK